MSVVINGNKVYFSQIDLKYLPLISMTQEIQRS